jgi:hypothetical protein
MNLKTAVNSGLFLVLTFCMASASLAQTSILKWKEVTSQFGPLPTSIKVFESENTYQDSAFKGFYVEIDTKDKNLHLDTDTTLFRRLTPQQFFNKLEQPLVVVNSSFVNSHK